MVYLRRGYKGVLYSELRHLLRVDADGKQFVLKTSSENETLVDWRSKIHIQKLAGDAGLALRVIHVDEARRAVLSTFVIDRSFPAFYGDPRTCEAALTQLGQMVRRVHELPLLPEAEPKNQLELLATIWSGPLANFALPAFVGDAVQRILTEGVPPSEHALVLSHNDVNPTNLVYDGEKILWLDWDTAGPNDPFYDLAAVSVFLRMDEGTCQRLLMAYDEELGSRIPAYSVLRRIVCPVYAASISTVCRYHTRTI
jgi:hypothetical protein